MKEAYRDQGTVAVVEHTVQDVRFALRQLWQEPGLRRRPRSSCSPSAWGGCPRLRLRRSGALRPLPYAEPDRLVDVTETNAAVPASNLSYLDFRDWQSMNSVFSQPRRLPAARPHAGDPGRHRDRAGHAGQRRVLPDARHHAALGRDFTRRRGRRGGAEVADHHAIGPGRSASAATPTWSAAASPQRRRHTIVGVLPPTFQFAPSGAGRVLDAAATPAAAAWSRGGAATAWTASGG